MVGIRVETKVLIVPWSKFIEIAEDSRGLGIFMVRRDELSVKAVVGRFASEKTCNNERELDETVKTLRRLNFAEVLDIADLTVWLAR